MSSEKIYERWQWHQRKVAEKVQRAELIEARPDRRQAQIAWGEALRAAENALNYCAGHGYPDFWQDFERAKLDAMMAGNRLAGW